MLEHPDPETIRQAVAQELKNHRIEARIKKLPKKKCTIVRNKVFQVPLESLPRIGIRINNQSVLVPKIAIGLCDSIAQDIDVEGIFRKQGSKARQNLIMKSLDSGKGIEEDWSTIDLAVILKTFLRKLPQPLIPHNLQKIFHNCISIEGDENVKNAIVLACLLLPVENLNLLMYLMEFFNTVANHADKNKMNAYNLSVVVSPNIFITKKIEDEHASNICEIVKIMIEHCDEIGLIPEQVLKTTTNEYYKQKKCKVWICNCPIL